MQNTDKSQSSKRQRSIIILFSFLILASLIAVLCRVYLRGDYMLSSEVGCDPAEESCFVRVCEEECDPENLYEYYKIRTVSAAYAPTCNPLIEECPDIACSAIPTCVETLCTEENVTETESCNDPKAYQATLDQPAFLEAGEEEINEVGE
jgi:hypothetical protein